MKFIFTLLSIILSITLSAQAFENIVINEFVADNETIATDTSGKYEDWIELYNKSDQSINLTGLYLSDDRDSIQKWALPNVSLGGDEYLIIWADNDPEEGIFHANFKLAAAGEVVILADSDVVYDSISYPDLDNDVAYARIPNATGPFVSTLSTFGTENMFSLDAEEEAIYNIHLFPSPADQHVQIEFGSFSPSLISVYQANGKLIEAYKLKNRPNISLDTQSWSNGMYFIELRNESASIIQKVMIQH